MDKIPVLRVFDENGNEIPIPAIQGRKGDKGDKGDGGDMYSTVYDPTGKKRDVFAYVDDSMENASPKDHTHTAEDVGARPMTWTPTPYEIGAAASVHSHNVEDVYGAVRVETGTYVGTGGTEVVINTAHRAKFVLIYACYGYSLGHFAFFTDGGGVVYRAANEENFSHSGCYEQSAEFAEDQVKIATAGSAVNELNESGKTYRYMYIG